MPKVSIIVPVYNVEKYIDRCIESIQKQTLTDWELILVDDCGNDKSMDIVKKYAITDKRIIFIESEKNVGPMVAREKGYKVSTGDYIAFVDGDDTLVMDALEILYTKAIESEADIVSGGIVRIKPDNSKIYSSQNDCEGIYSKKEIFNKLLKYEFAHNLCAKLFRGELIRNGDYKTQVGLTHGEDGYFFYQIVEKIDRVVSIRNIVYEYWMIETSSTHKELTKDMIKSMAISSMLQYDILSRELGDVKYDFYKILYWGFANNAKRFPADEMAEIYRQCGFELNLTFANLRRYMSFLEAVKSYIKIHLYRKFI